MPPSSPSRTAVVVFIVVGLLVGLVLVLRDLRDTEVPEETGTLPGRVVVAGPGSVEPRTLSRGVRR